MPTTDPDRPRLLPHAVPLVRDLDSLQLGLWPDGAVVLDGLTAAEIEFVRGLDGTRDRRGLLREAGDVRAELLLRTMTDAGALAGPADRSRPDRPAPVVLVQGVGRLADDIGLQLAAHGRARVLRSEDAGAAHRPGDRPSLVVLVEHRVVGPDVRSEVEELAAPILPVLHDGPHGSIGPLVVPGESACLRCLDLRRTDLDPAWASLVRQATTGAVRPDLAQTDPLPELAPLLSASAVMVAECALAGRCPVGVSLELSLPWPQQVQRRWAPHPACGCVQDQEVPSVTMGA